MGLYGICVMDRWAIIEGSDQSRDQLNATLLHETASSITEPPRPHTESNLAIHAVR